MLRAVSLPFDQAQLISTDELAVFTRPWRTPYKGVVAIHSVCAVEGQGHDWSDCRVIVAVAPLLGIVEYTNVTWDDDTVDATEWAVSKTAASLPVSQKHLLDSIEPTPGRWLFILGQITPVRVPHVGKSGAGLWAVNDAQQIEIATQIEQQSVAPPPR